MSALCVKGRCPVRNVIPRRQLQPTLLSRGFTKLRQNGHCTWQHTDGTIVVVPNRPRQDQYEGPAVKLILSKELVR